MNTKEVDIATVNSKLETDGCGVIDDWEMKPLALLAREEYYQSMQECQLAPQKQQFHYSDLEKKPHRKLAIGSTNGIGDPYAQFLQTTYFSMNDPKYPNLGKVFAGLIKLRNEILGISSDFGNNPKRDGFWNACRIHHYPSGGGFMIGHRDTHFPSLLEKSGHPFLQILVLLTSRGQEFTRGGGFVVNRKGEKVLYEDETSVGKVAYFDGSIVHGVDDVDNDKVVDFQSKAGRIAGFVGLYKVLD